MSCDIEMQHTSAIMTDHEEAVEHLESEGRYGKEVHGGDGFAMVPQKGKPTFGRLGISRRSAHPAGDSPLGNIETEHQELAVYSGCAPSRVLGHHSRYEIAHFPRNPSSTHHPA